MLYLRGLDTVRFTKVEGHADEGMVLDGRVREQDRVGNYAADEAADFGRRRFDLAVIDARRNLSGVCGRYYPVILDMHRFFIAISLAGVVPCCLDHRLFGFLNGLVFLHLLLALKMLLIGHTLLALWLCG